MQSSLRRTYRIDRLRVALLYLAFLLVRTICTCCFFIVSVYVAVIFAYDLVAFRVKHNTLFAEFAVTFPHLTTSLSYGNHLAKHHAQFLLIPLILILFYSPFAVFYYHRYYTIILTLIKFVIPALLRHGVRSVWIKPMATTRD